MSDATVKIEHKNGVAILTLNRPDKLNSFNEDMHKALFLAFEAARDDATVRCILLTGAGRAFSAGQDLSARVQSENSTPPDLGETLDKYYNPLIRLISNINKPVVCAVNGVAAGAGANVALACDLVVCAQSASFLQAFARIGLVPDSGGTWVLPRLIGLARAKALCLLAEPISAQKALELGMVWQVFGDDTFADEAFALCEKLAKGPTFGMGLIKQAFENSANATLDEQLDFERDLQRKAGQSHDYKEGVLAFMEKRAPNYIGS